MRYFFSNFAPNHPNMVFECMIDLCIFTTCQQLEQMTKLTRRKFIRYFHKSIAKKINSIKPDLILITGDSVDETEKIGLLDNSLN
jgi:hypothetical protein